MYSSSSLGGGSFFYPVTILVPSGCAIFGRVKQFIDPIALGLVTVSWGGFCSSSTPYVKSLSCSLSDLQKPLNELLMCSGRKKPPEALQDHRALGKAEARAPLWQGAWKPGCLPEAYLVLGILSHLTQLSRKSGGQEIPNQGQRSLLWVLHPGSEG